MGKHCLKCNYVQPETVGRGYDPECPKCGAFYSKVEAATGGPSPPSQPEAPRTEAPAHPIYREIPPQAFVSSERPAPAWFTASNRRMLGMAGGAALIVGAFLPLIRAPIIGSISYINNGRGDGWFLVLFGAVTLIAVWRGSYKPLWWTGGLSAALVAYGFYRMSSTISTAQADLATSLKGNPFGGIATGLAAGIQMEFGWAVLALAVVMTLIAAAVRPRDDAE